MAKLNFNIRMDFFDAEIQRAFDKLEDVGKKDARKIMSSMRIRGIEHAHELLDRLIYFTPQRSAYERTYDLRKAVQGFVRNEGGTLTLYMYATGAPYALFNELGTMDYRMTEDQIIELSKNAMQDDAQILILDFGREEGRKGLEPRPFMYPTMVWLEVQLEKQFIKYLNDAVSGI